MFKRPWTQSTPAKRNQNPFTLFKGKAKTGNKLTLPPVTWDLGTLVPKVIEIELSPDNQEFLMMARAADAPDGLNQFINSLLWQERFRQGYATPEADQTPSKTGNLLAKLRVLTFKWIGRNKTADS